MNTRLPLQLPRGLYGRQNEIGKVRELTGCPFHEANIKILTNDFLQELNRWWREAPNEPVTRGEISNLVAHMNGIENARSDYR